MSKKHIVTEKEIASFNIRRKQMVGVELTRSEVFAELKHLNYNPCNNFLQAITDKENAPIIRLNRGKYLYNPKPVYKLRLQLVWDIYSELNNKYGNKQTVSITKAIEILKNAGYQVLKPVTQYEEV